MNRRRLFKGKSFWSAIACFLIKTAQNRAFEVYHGGAICAIIISNYAQEAERAARPLRGTFKGIGDVPQQAFLEKFDRSDFDKMSICIYKCPACTVAQL